MSCLSRLNWRGPGPVFSIAVLEIEIKHRSDDPDDKWWGWESEKTLRPEESQVPLPDSTATQPHCEWGKPRGLPLPFLPKKMSLHLKTPFQSPSCSSVVRSTPAWVWWWVMEAECADGDRWQVGGQGSSVGHRDVAKDWAHRSTDAWINCLLFTAWVYCSAFN